MTTELVASEKAETLSTIGGRVSRIAPRRPVGPRKLSPEERESLADLEKVIEAGLAAFVEVGIALMQVRDFKLYRETHATFEKYCKDRWDITHRHANRLIASAGVVAILGPMGPVLPMSERQARPLTTLPKDEVEEVWEHAKVIAPKDSEGQPKVTEKHVRAAVNERLAASAAFDPLEQAVAADLTADVEDADVQPEPFDLESRRLRVVNWNREEMEVWPEEHRRSLAVLLEELAEEARG